MPKYILHGGKEEQPSPMNDAFFDALVSEVPENGQLLINYFARDKQERPALFAREKARVLKIAEVQNKNIRVVCGDLNNFEQQVNESDVIYFVGGNSKKQMENSKQFKHLLSKNKVYAGSSSGSYLMGHAFCSDSFPEKLNEGCGVVPFNILAHCNDPDYAEFTQDLLAKSHSTRPLLSIREGEFVTLEY